jgi:hypothetical protein
MFGDRKYHTYLNFSEYIKSHISLEEQEKLWRHFSDQLKQYTEQSELNFKPFSILKIVYQNGLEELFFDKKTEDIYSTISDDSYLVIDMHKNEDWKKAKDYFEKLSYNEKMEGVVIKPETVYNPKIAPNIKVRNKYYLTLVYGYDYLSEHKYQKLINKKNINKKLRTSIKEFELAKKMLEVKYDDINPENEAYYQLVGQMILEVKSEKDLDPRL